MIEIRQYQPLDAGVMVELMSELGYPTSLDDMKKRMERIEANPDYHTFVAIMDAKVAGMVGIRIVWNYESSPPATQISSIVTKSIYRGQGVGTRLIEYVEQWALEHESETVFLTSGSKPERLVAHALYEKLGYIRTGLRFVKSLQEEGKLRSY